MKVFAIFFLVLFSVVVVVAGLWLWPQASDMVLDWGFGRPAVALWAVRSAAIAAVAGAQVILLVPVIGGIYRRGVADTVAGLAAAVIFVLALGGTIACAFAGR